MPRRLRGAPAQRPPEQVAFAVEDMAATTWEQLALRVGWATGYVYCHQGCCEHALYIADARRVHPDDPRRRSAYPLQSFQARAAWVHGACARALHASGLLVLVLVLRAGDLEIANPARRLTPCFGSHRVCVVAVSTWTARHPGWRTCYFVWDMR